jgi:photosynthetic reaction center cytochrome c subunit
MNWKPALLVAAAIALLSAGGTSIEHARAQAPGTPSIAATAGPKKTEEQFKNIQILKGLPADQLIPAMQFITASLGVECEFCHVQGAFEKDDKKPKQTARKMMEMMFAINKDNFDGHREVTCYSCHRGNFTPVATPPVMGDEPTAAMAQADPGAKSESKEEEGGEGPAASPTGGPTADQLIDKYIQAVGGAAAIDKVSSRVMKGSITFGDRSVPINIFSKEPDKRISFTPTPDGDSVTAFDGHEGWLGFPGRPAREMHGPDVDAAAMDADLHFPTHLKSMFSGTEVHGMEKVDGHDAYLVIGQRAGKTPLKLYFGAHSGLLDRLVRYGETPLGQLPTQIDYADYRDAAGVKIPFRWTLARPGDRFTIQLSEAKENVPVDESKFAKTPAPIESQKGPAR